MRSQAVVMTQADFDTWKENAGKPPAGGGGTGGGGSGKTGEQIFLANNCGTCHTFKPIPSAVGKIGPDLDNLKEAAATAGKPLEDFIRESIVDPNAYLAPGFKPPSGMPPFASIITGDDLDTLVQYLAENTS
jgi:cytochrome c oxidase subunit 2